MAAKFLILETSGKSGAVALADDAAVRAERRLDETRRHARDLAPAVHSLLAEAGWTPRQIDAVIVSRGPGSYTGLRVGIMSAKTFAYATGAALFAIDTFAAIALQSPSEAANLDVLADAQQDRVYIQRFTRTDGEALPSASTPLAIQPLSQWSAALAGSTWVSGPGVARYRDRLPAEVQVAPADCWDPRPESLLRLTLPRFLAGERDDAWSIEPLYLRPSSAEEKWTALGR